MSDKAGIGAKARSREVFQIEDIAAIAPAFGQIDQLRHHPFAGGWIGQEPVGHLAIEGHILGVEQNRQNGRAMGRRRDHGCSLRIFGEGYGPLGVLQSDPLRGDHIQLGQMVGQGMARKLIPTDIKPNRQGLGLTAARGHVRMGHTGPTGLSLQTMDIFAVHRRQGPRVTKFHIRQARRCRKGHEKGGNDRQDA